MKSNLRNEIKSYIVRRGMTMQEVVDLLRDEHGWSDSVSNLSNIAVGDLDVGNTRILLHKLPHGLFPMRGFAFLLQKLLDCFLQRLFGKPCRAFSHIDG